MSRRLGNPPSRPLLDVRHPRRAGHVTWRGDFERDSARKVYERVREEQKAVDAAGHFARDVALVVFVTFATCVVAVFALFAAALIVFA